MLQWTPLDAVCVYLVNGPTTVRLCSFLEILKKKNVFVKYEPSDQATVSAREPQARCIGGVAPKERLL